MPVRLGALLCNFRKTFLKEVCYKVVSFEPADGSTKRVVLKRGAEVMTSTFFNTKYVNRPFSTGRLVAPFHIMRMFSRSRLHTNILNVYTA